MDIEDTSKATLHASVEAVQRFCAMPFGISSHWGLYALLGRGEWVMHNEHIPVEEYERLVPQFNPAAFDAEAWGDIIAASGARAFMITAKHHDGFCLYDSSVTAYKVTNTPFGRDPLAELAAACQRRGIALHIYYSLLDWHHPAYRTDWPAYVAYYQEQVRELCTNYGELGGLLFDGYWPKFPLGEDAQYFLPGGAWDLAGTYDLIHSLQPGAMIVNNHHVLPLQGEDYQAFELDLPGENTVGFNCTEIGTKPLATWFTVNRGWAYMREQQEVKPVGELVRFITQSAARNAKCWLNIGPCVDGSILPEEADRLRELGLQAISR
jgi:alpha-L-fucosidase